jgi:hypothetical protein
LIFVRSEKDATKPPQAGGVKKNGEPSYLQPYNQKFYSAHESTFVHGLFAHCGVWTWHDISHRDPCCWPKLNEKRRTALVMSLYPQTQSNPKLAANVVKMLDTAIGTEVAENQGWAATYEADGLTAGTGVTGGMHATYQDRYNQPVSLKIMWKNAGRKK